jgi:hypothetical protein
MRNPLCAAARAGLFCFREVEHFALAGQIRRLASAAVASAFHGHFGHGTFWGRGRHLVCRTSQVEKSWPFDTLSTPTEGQAYQRLNMGLLLVDSGPQA